MATVEKAQEAARGTFLDSLVKRIGAIATYREETFLAISSKKPFLKMAMTGLFKPGNISWRTRKRTKTSTASLKSFCAKSGSWKKGRKAESAGGQTAGWSSFSCFSFCAPIVA